MFMSEQMQQKWAPVLDHPDLPEIKDKYKKAVTAVLLENQEKQAAQEVGGNMLFEAAPTTSMGASADNAGGATGNFKFADPVMISLVRRAMPQLIAYDVCGVQPMSGPTGLIFAMRAKYDSPGGATEAFYDEPTTNHSAESADGTTTQTGANPAGASEATPGTNYTVVAGADGATGEALGDGSGTGNHFAEMSFAIDKVTVTAKTRALKGEYSMELAQDLKAVHGLDAETELSNILSTEVLAEINREVIRTIYIAAQKGAPAGSVATAGIFDMDVDSNGRWMVEKFKGLIFQIEREANSIAKNTRRGKGNIILTSSDVASALQMAGVLDYTPAMSTDLNVDDTGNTFAGVLNGRYRVYVDPYSTDAASATGTVAPAGSQYFVVGYKGSSAYDAGMFYCPYVPLQMVRAVGENTFQPKIGFKTRYGMISNPFATSAGTGVLTTDTNYYYRRVAVHNLM